MTKLKHAAQLNLKYRISQSIQHTGRTKFRSEIWETWSYVSIFFHDCLEVDSCSKIIINYRAKKLRKEKSRST